MKVACSYCRYFASKSARHRHNECRRHVPTPRLVIDRCHDQLGRGIWPAVAPDDWCGEFKRRLTLRSSTNIGDEPRSAR